ncbi:MAG: family 16 glycoside hydrolase [Planctomycetota bacterium]
MSYISLRVSRNRPLQSLSTMLAVAVCLLLVTAASVSAAPEEFGLVAPLEDSTICSTKSPRLQWTPSFVVGETFIMEDMSTEPSGEFKNTATYQSDKKVVRLTEAESRTQGQLEYSMNPGAQFVAEWDFRVREVSGGSNYFYFYNNRTPQNRGTKMGGYMLGFNNQKNRIYLAWNADPLVSVRDSGFTDGEWHNVKVVVDGRDITVYLDGVPKIEYTDEERDNGGEHLGWGGYNAGHKARQQIRDLRVYRAKPVDLYEVTVDGNTVKKVESTQLEVNPLDYGQHEWYVTAVDSEGNKTRSENTRSFSLEKGVGIALGGDIQTSNPPFLPETVETWQNNPLYPDFEFSVQLGDFMGVRHSQPTEEGIENAVNFYSNYLTTFSGQITGNHDMADWKTRPDYPYKGMHSFQEETGLSTRSFAFLYDNVLFINLGDTGGEARINKQTLAWLDSLTSRYPDKPTVFFAHPATNKVSVGEQTRDYMVFQLNREDRPYFWEKFMSQDQIVAWLHGHSENLKDDTLEGYYGVVYGNTVEAAFPSFRPFAESVTEDSGYVRITSDSIECMVWDEKRDKIVEKRVETGYDLDITDDGFQKIFIPKFVQDGEKWELTNYLGSRKVQLNLIGTDYTNLAYNNHFNKFSGNTFCHIENPGYQGKAEDDGRAVFDGKEDLRLADEDEGCGNEDPEMSWINAIPGKTYVMNMWVKGDEPEEGVMDVTVRYSEGNINEFSSTDKVFSDIDVTDEYQKYTTEFTVPSNPDLWKAQIVWQSKGANTYYMDRWTLRRKGQGPTEDFRVMLNGKTFSADKPLKNNQMVSFDLDPTRIDGTTPISASISGNKVGVMEIQHEDLVFKCPHAAVDIQEVTEDSVDVGLKRLAKYNDAVKFFPLTEIVDSTASKVDDFKHIYWQVPNSAFENQDGLLPVSFTTE